MGPILFSYLTFSDSPWPSGDLLSIYFSLDGVELSVMGEGFDMADWGGTGPESSPPGREGCWLGRREGSKLLRKQACTALCSARKDSHGQNFGPVADSLKGQMWIGVYRKALCGRRQRGRQLRLCPFRK